MTANKKFKKAVRRLADKSNHKYCGALRAISGVPAPNEELAMQLLHTFKNTHDTTFSVQCSKCTRWIWCGKDARDGTCICGASYRIVFDAAEDWTMKQGRVCMDCGAAFRLTTSAEGRNPWRHVNAWQGRCDRCSLEAATDERAAVMAGMQRQAVTMVETQINGGLRTSSEVKEVTEIEQEAREDLELFNKAQTRIVADASAGHNRIDPDLVSAFQKLQTSLAKLQDARLSAFERERAKARRMLQDYRYRDLAWVFQEMVADNEGRTVWSSRFEMPADSVAEAVIRAFTARDASRAYADGASNQVVVEYDPFLVDRIAAIAILFGGVLCERLPRTSLH